MLSVIVHIPARAVRRWIPPAYVFFWLQATTASTRCRCCGTSGRTRSSTTSRRTCCACWTPTSTRSVGRTRSATLTSTRRRCVPRWTSWSPSWVRECRPRDDQSSVKWYRYRCVEALTRHQYQTFDWRLDDSFLTLYLDTGLTGANSYIEFGIQRLYLIFSEYNQ